YFSRRFVLTLISKDLAQSAGYKPHMLELLFLLIFALAVAAGIKFVGALLMGSLIIIPAAASRNLAASLNAYLGLSAAIGIAGALIGILGAAFYHLSPGPTFILAVGAFFLVSIFFRRR
ncbi:MAG: metal ABC transporter permease, partial [Patescibacteria group bacterium]